ncbi:MAG: ABC transporter substrate-binding protein [Candidatus Acetothermia bacterium]
MMCQWNFKKFQGMALVSIFVLVFLFAGVLLATAQQEESEGPIVIGMTEEPKDLNPISYPDVYSDFVLTQLYDPLLRNNPGGEINTGGRAVAKDFSVSEDGLTYVFELQKGIQFHHGEEMDAEDVAYTINTLRNDEAPVSPRKQDYEAIESVEVTGEYEVTVKLDEAFTPFLADAMTAVYPVPKDYIEEHGWEEYDKEHFGTGPYEFEEYKSGSHILVKRNESYWGDHSANTEKLKFAFYGESSTAVMALRRGEIHFLERMDINQWFDLKDAEEVVPQSYPKLAFIEIGFNQKEPPFDDPRVRKAFAYAIDSKEVIAAERTEELADDTRSPLPPSMPAHAAVNQYEQDIEKARELLQEAGHDEINTKLYTTEGKALEEQVVQQQVKAAGFNVELEKLEWGSFLDAVEGGEAPLWTSGWTTGSGTPYALLELFHSESNWNYYVGWYENEEFDKALDEAIKTTDADERTELYKKCQRILVDEDMGAFIQYTRHAFPAYHESLNVPDDAWNPYMGMGPIKRAYEWSLEN